MTDQDQRRADFEAWFVKNYQAKYPAAEEHAIRSHTLERRKEGGYYNVAPQAGWDAWQAALNHKAADVELPEPDAWSEFDGEGGYDYRSFENNESFKEDYLKRNGAAYASWVVGLYTEQQVRALLAAAPQPPKEQT